MIGIFDSGIGGLTVVKNIVEKCPLQDIVYFGDTARCPYGEKDRDTIISFSLNNARFLNQWPLDALIVACGTASACAIDALQQEMTIPVIGVIDTAVQAAVNATKNGRVAILATTTTIASRAYQEKLQSTSSLIQTVPLPCPQFVPLLEKRCVDSKQVRAIVKETLQPIVNSEIDTAILGCTHYPLLADIIQEELGPAVTLIDTSKVSANSVIDFCKEGSGLRHYYVSDNPEKFQELSFHFFNEPISASCGQR